MRFATRHLSVLLSLPLLVLTAEAVTSAEEPRNRIEDAAHARSDLYDVFDPERLGREYLSHFERNAEFSAVSNVRLTPPNRWFKTFRIKGQISADRVAPLVDSLQGELNGLAERSSVEVVVTEDSVAERPVGLLQALVPTYTVNLSSLQGRHISYRDGQTRGDVDILAFQYLNDKVDDLLWCVLCSVHEPAEPRSDRARILGTWRVVGSIGSEETPMQALGTEVEFTADFMILKPKSAKDPSEWLKLDYKLDPAPNPKHIDTKHRLGPKEKPIIQLGIYALDKDELRFGLASAGQTRPTEFQSIPQAFVLKRAKKR
jgi:uncharacterized protein (TIGR03067 family)